MMKRPRHRPRPKPAFLQALARDGVSQFHPDLYADLPPEIRNEYVLRLQREKEHQTKERW
jgi:hypothetical protein